MPIPYGRQSISEEDIEAVAEVLRGSWLTQGPAIEKFEAAVAEYVGAEYAVAFSSGTAALHGAAWASGLGPGDVAYTSPITFMATPNAVRYVGAKPGLLDIRTETWNLDLSLLPRDADAVLPVHYAGLPVDLHNSGWKQRPRVVIEDAAHALGALTPDGPVGNCANSDLTCFSFHPVKPITTGEGGMVTTNEPELADRLRRFRSHCIVRSGAQSKWRYEISELGHHYRMTDIQAALGAVQLTRLNSFIEKRNEIAETYRARLEGFPIVLPPKADPGFLHGYHLFPVRVPNRELVYDFLHAADIRVQVHYVPVHHHPISSDLVGHKSVFPKADWLYDGLLSLPIFPDMTQGEVDEVIHSLEASLESVG